MTDDFFPEDTYAMLMAALGNDTAAKIGVVMFNPELADDEPTAEDFLDQVRMIFAINPEDSSVHALTARWAAVATLIEYVDGDL